MAIDTKQTKSIGEHWVCAALAKRDWAPALTRDGLSRTDILAVQVTGERRMVEIQVKTTRNDSPRATWMLGLKGVELPLSDREYYVFVLTGTAPESPIRTFVVPRLHVSAATHINYHEWISNPHVPAGTRNTPQNQTRVPVFVFEGYEDRWDILDHPAEEAPILLPAECRDFALLERVGLPEGHPWRESLPEW